MPHWHLQKNQFERNTSTTVLPNLMTPLLSQNGSLASGGKICGGYITAREKKYWFGSTVDETPIF